MGTHSLPHVEVLFIRSVRALRDSLSLQTQFPGPTIPIREWEL